MIPADWVAEIEKEKNVVKLEGISYIMSQDFQKISKSNKMA